MARKILWRPRKLPFRRRVTRAAVALVIGLSEAGEPQILFIRRASRPGDPWSGDMAFPGGKLQSGDRSTKDAAIRETLEETGLDLTQSGAFRDRLADLLTRHHSRWVPMVVSPYVFIWNGPVKPELNHEVQELVWVPLRYLANPEHQTTRVWKTRFGRFHMPCCNYQGYSIWGLSYGMLQDLLAHRWMQELLHQAERDPD